MGLTVVPMPVSVPFRGVCTKITTAILRGVILYGLVGTVLWDHTVLYPRHRTLNFCHCEISNFTQWFSVGGSWSQLTAVDQINAILFVKVSATIFYSICDCNRSSYQKHSSWGSGLWVCIDFIILVVNVLLRIEAHNLHQFYKCVFDERYSGLWLSK